jgi:CO/xanthine dehydrogenase FAD-binding subunit
MNRDLEMNWIAYERPKSISDALTVLEESDGRARVIAGGTDLILQLKHRELHTDLLVDITGIEELRQIREKGGWIHIGAGVTHAEVAKNPLVRKEAKALADGCAQVGSPQIRNIATLIGNVISAQPAGDGAIPLAALEAEVKVASKTGERWVPLEETYRGIGLSQIDAFREVATEVRFKKLGEKGQTRFFRLSRRKALALPVLNGAVALLLNPGMTQVQEARIALGPVAEKPFRPRSAEAYLQSKEISSEIVLKGARIASEEASPRTSRLRGSDFYRKEMIRLYLERTFQDLLESYKRGWQI